MPSLKDLKNRINSVKSTRKITSAMKLVAGAKLRRAQERAEKARPYAERMARMLESLAANVTDGPKLMTGTGKNDIHLLVALTADRGLCGGFNHNIVKSTIAMVKKLEAEGKTVKILAVGRRGRDALTRVFGDKVVAGFDNVGARGVEYHEAEMVAAEIFALFEAGEFDICTIVYNKFISAMTQEVTPVQLIPYSVDETEGASNASATYEYEPDEEKILADLLPRNITVQLFSSLLESAASEQGARMTAMDNATRNAGDLISDLSLTYNRSRQAQITTELTEIISGAQAV